jgi:mevalonate kinase
MTAVRVARASAPGRICLAGESLDWMVAGPSVVAAIERRTWVSMHLVDTAADLLIRSGAPVDASRIVAGTALGELAGDALDYVQAVAYQAGQLPGRAPAGQLHISSELAVAAGVSSSASVTTAVAAALLAAMGVEPLPETVVRLAYAGERMTGSGAGWMDFLAVAHGGVNLVDAGEPPTVRRLADGLDASIVLVDTLARRSTRDHLIDKRRRWSGHDPDLIAYVEATPGLVAQLASAIAAPAPDPAEIGSLVTDAHRLLATRMRCSTPLIDTCVDACLTAGAYGAKLTGSGHGGCLFALAAPERVGAVLAALHHLPVHAVVLDGSGGVQITLDPPDEDREGSRSEGCATWTS